MDTHEQAKKWRAFLPEGLPRGAVKRPVMANPYGIRKHTAQDYLRSWMLEQQEKVGRRPWGHSTYAPAAYLNDIVWKSMESLTRPAVICMQWLRKIATQSHTLRWTNPVGFPVIQSCPKTEGKTVTVFMHSTKVAVTPRNRTAETSKVKQRDGLPPNFVHSLDSAALTETMDRCAKAGIQDFAMVHDSYGTRAEDAVTMNRILRETFADIFERPLLAEFAEEISHYCPEIEIPPVPELGTLDPREVISSPHFFG